MSFWQESDNQQPGSNKNSRAMNQNDINVAVSNSKDINNKENNNNSNNNNDDIAIPNSPASRAKMIEKRELRDLNARLQMYIANQNNKSQTIETYKNLLAKQEIDFRNKIREKENQFNKINEKLRSENESLQYQSKSMIQEMQTLENNISDLQERVDINVKRGNEKEIEIDGLNRQLAILNNELTSLRSENADIKYKYSNFDNDRNKLLSQCKQLKERNNGLIKDLTKAQSENRSQREAFNRLYNEKSNEIDKISETNRLLMSEKEEIQNKLRIEFDTKLKEFVTKREEQYKQEKEEWMRIFKQEFNRKLRSYKDANLDLSNNNSKLEEEIIDLRNNLKKLKQCKTEIEITLRNTEDEYEKIKTDLNNIKKTKDIDIKNKLQIIKKLREEKKQKDIEFDEVVGIKIQLAQEIDLYRRIMNEAEQSAGYMSPLSSLRKKRKVTKSLPNGNNNNNNNNNNAGVAGDTHGIFMTTPGIVRGAQLARKDLNNLDSMSMTDGNNTTDNEDIDTEMETENEDDHSNNNNKNKNLGQKRRRQRRYSNNNNKHKNNSGNDADNELKDDESDVTNENVLLSDGITPGGESYPLQFSTIDLNESMVEIENISDVAISLRGYTLTNSDGSAQFALPNNKVLNKNEKLKIMIGLRCKIDENNNSNGSGNNSNIIIWKADVWTGDEEDVIRLYDPNSQEIATIDIHPDMLPNDTKNNKNCKIM